MKKKNLVFTIIAIVSAVLLVSSMVFGFLNVNIEAKASLFSTLGTITGLVGATSLFVLGILKWIVGNKEQTILKIIVLTAIYMLVLSWIIPASLVYGTEVMNLGLNKASLYSALVYPYNTFMLYSSFQALIFILTVGGFYGILHATGKYNKLLEKIAKSLKGNELLFLGVVTFILATLSSLVGLNLVLLIFIPAICSILLLLGYDKITAFAASFLSPIIGVIGATYSLSVTNILNTATGTQNTEGMVYKIALFLVTYAVFLVLLILRAKKNKSKANQIKEQLELTTLDKANSKKPMWPLIVVMSVLLVLVILGYTDWSGAFKITLFTDIHKAVTEKAIIFNIPVFGDLLNGTTAFGTWFYSELSTLNYQNAIILLFIASIILCLIYKIKLNDAIKAFAEGVKKVAGPAVLVTLSYTLLFVNGNHTVFITMVQYIIDLVSGASGFLKNVLVVLISGLSTIISTFIHIDTYYVAQSTAVQLVTAYSGYGVILNVITQAFHGLAQLFVPTSALLIIGLYYLDISYKEWMKSSWKLLLALLAAILLVVITMMIVVL